MVRKTESTAILRRGSACLSCRRRKLKCDGIRPACDQCTTMKRTHECKYDDSNRKSHTRKLREHQEVLEARLRELESKRQDSRPSASSAPLIEVPTPAIISQATTAWNVDPFDTRSSSHSSTFSSLVDPLWDVQTRPSTSSTTLSGGSASISLIPDHNDTIFAAMPFSDSSGTTAHDGTPDRVLHEPTVTLSVEMHNKLIRTFIKHRKQCCFYSDTSRFDSSSSATVYQNSPASTALMSVIYLLGSFFVGLKDLEKQLLEKTLHEVARILHNQEQLLDLAQALCLLAEYFYFNNRDIEGSRHLNAAKRLALELRLHQLSHPTFSYDIEFQPDFGLWDSEWREQAAVFWQVFMVDNLWSANNGCSLQPNLESPCPNIITPLPIDDSLDLGLAFGNSTIHSLFEGDPFHASSLSTTAFKVMAACIFDRSLRVHNTSSLAPRDQSLWAYRHSVEVALQRLSGLVHPFIWPDFNAAEGPSIDMDLYVIHTLIVASTIHLQINDVIDLKMSWAAKRAVELIHHLVLDDFRTLDPVLALCWSAILRVFNQMIKQADKAIKGQAKCDGSASHTATFLHPCIETLHSALQNMSVSVSLADHFIRIQEMSHPPLYVNEHEVSSPLAGDFLSF